MSAESTTAGWRQINHVGLNRHPRRLRYRGLKASRGLPDQFKNGFALKPACDKCVEVVDGHQSWPRTDGLGALHMA